MLDLFQEAKARGITVEYCQLPLNQSISVQDDDGDFVLMDLSLMWSGAKERTHLGHEIAHSATGTFYNPYTPLEVRKRYENIADKWAIHRLVPLQELKAAIKAGYTELWELAERFTVTEDFMRKAICLYKNGNLDE